MGIPALTGDTAVLAMGMIQRIVPLTLGGRLRQDGRPAILEGVVCAGDGTILMAQNPTGKTGIVKVDGASVIFLGAPVTDNFGFVGTITRTTPPSNVLNLE